MSKETRRIRGCEDGGKMDGMDEVSRRGMSKTRERGRRNRRYGCMINGGVWRGMGRRGTERVVGGMVDGGKMNGWLVFTRLKHCNMVVIVVQIKRKL
jgi:hypothetical protein